jgi:uncharacterized protein
LAGVTFSRAFGHVGVRVSYFIRTVRGAKRYIGQEILEGDILLTSITLRRHASRTILWLVVIGVLAAPLFPFLPANSFVELSAKLNLFATVFLGIFIEALPYLLVGTLISGMVEVFVDRDQITRFISNRSVPAAVTGALMELVFPVYECGVIPLARRLFHKGLPLAAGVAFLLVAPVLNPIVLFSTAAAFGWGPMLLWRIGFTLLIAVVVGLVFSVERNSSTILLGSLGASHEHHHETGSFFGEKIQQALVICADELFEMGRYLIIGAMLAASSNSSYAGLINLRSVSGSQAWKSIKWLRKA